MAEGDSFTCEVCLETFEKEWTDEEAAAEYDQNFPRFANLPEDERAMICDDCFQKMMHA